MDRAVLLYDRDCGFCRWSADRLLAWDRGRRLLAVAIQDPQADRPLADMEPERRMASWHLVPPGGPVHSGARAVAPLLRLLSGGAPLAALADAFPRTTDRLYGWVARNRGRLGELIGTERCAVDPSRDRP